MDRLTRVWVGYGLVNPCMGEFMDQFYPVFG